jgi:hypothetical protein
MQHWPSHKQLLTAVGVAANTLLVVLGAVAELDNAINAGSGRAHRQRWRGGG